MAVSTPYGLPELIRPDYTIQQYTEQLYKIVRFKSTLPRLGPGPKSKHQKHDNKLDASISRAKNVVLQLALCNQWDYFCTFTISPEKYDRSNLEKWRDSFTQWIRDQRKKGYIIEYVLVPEQHIDGSWHAHGFFKGNVELVPFKEELTSGMNVPVHLAKDGYYDWPGYREKFGFCSFGLIHNSVAAAFYIVKYLTKDNSRNVSEVGLHLYYCSQGLNRAKRHGEIFGNCQYLDQFLENHYEFCDTGMTKIKDNLDWTFALEYMSLELLSDPEPPQEVVSLMEDMEQFTQFALNGFGGPDTVAINDL